MGRAATTAPGTPDPCPDGAQPSAGWDPPVVDLGALLQAGQQAEDEGLEAGQEQLLQREEVLLIQAEQHGPHRHGRVRQEGKEPAALGKKRGGWDE